MHAFTLRQLALLDPLPLIWGINWPVMKLGAADHPAPAFRSLSLRLGLSVLALVLVGLRWC